MQTIQKLDFPGRCKRESKVGKQQRSTKESGLLLCAAQRTLQLWSLFGVHVLCQTTTHTGDIRAQFEVSHHLSQCKGVRFNPWFQFFGREKCQM